MIRFLSSLIPRAPRFLFVPAAVAVVLSSSAIAAPRVGVVVVSHEGVTDEQADDIAYDLAGAIATQIDGEAIAGTSVRSLLVDGLPPDCDQDNACGRKIARTLKTDETLFLVVKKTTKKDYAVHCHRVARDPDRLAADGELTLTGNKAKRTKAIDDLVSTLFPAGSVVAYVEPPPPVVVAVPDPKKKKDASSDPLVRKWWFWVALGGGVAVVGGVATGLAFGLQPGPSAPSVMLPP